MYPIELFYRSVTRWPDKVAVEASNESLTYAELADRVDRAATGLIALDPNQGSRVCLCGYNSLEHLIAWLAVLAAGKVWVPLYPKNSASELKRSVEWVSSSVVLATEGLIEVFGENDCVVLPLESWIQSTSGLSGTKSDWMYNITPDLSATQAIKFTGGTTGRPKGVQQPYRAWNCNVITQILTYGFDSGTRYLTAAPITHGTSTYIVPTLAVGGTLVLADRPRPSELLEILKRDQISTVFLPPTVIYMMLDELRGSRASFPKLRHLIYGAAPMRPDGIDAALETFGSVLHSTYGQTEAPQIATHIGPAELASESLKHSVGRATPLTKVALLDSHNITVEPGFEGEILIHGDLVMSGYWADQEKTEEAFHRSWLRTGDIGTFDSNGYLFIKGRIKEMIISGGFNVYPSDIELVLGEHPAVRDAVVFGIPDSKWGEAVHAVIELNAGQHVDEKTLLEIVRERLGPVRTPKALRVWDQIPRNPFGKINRNNLVEKYLKEEL